MSLAQKSENLPTNKLEIVSPAEPAAPPKASTPIDFRLLVRRTPERPSIATPASLAVAAASAASASVQHAVPATIAIATPSGALPSDAPGAAKSAVALDLLSEVSSALSVLMDRCHGLESALEATHEQAKTDLEASNGEALKFLHRSEMLAQTVAQLEETVTSLQQRLAIADQQVATVSAVAEKKQHEAAAAECLSTLFQQRVLSSFGEGSVGHSILESVRIRSQT